MIFRSDYTVIICIIDVIVRPEIKKVKIFLFLLLLFLEKGIIIVLVYVFEGGEMYGGCDIENHRVG